MEEYKPQASRKIYFLFTAMLSVNLFLKFSSFKIFESKSFVHFFAGKEKLCSYFSEENLKKNLQPFEPRKEPVKKHPTIVTKNIFFMIFFYFLKFVLPHHTFYRSVGLPAIFCIFF